MNVGELFLGRDFARRHPQGRQSYHTSRESVQSTAPAFPADRVRSAGQRKQCGTMCQRLWLLDTVGLDAVLPTRPRRFFAPRFATAWAVAWASWFISASARPPNKSTLWYANEHR